MYLANDAARQRNSSNDISDFILFALRDITATLSLVYPVHCQFDPEMVSCCCTVHHLHAELQYQLTGSVQESLCHQ